MIQSISLSIILLLATARHALGWTLSWIALYSIYFGFMTRFGGRAAKFVKTSNEGQLLRAVVLWVGVFIYLAYLYLGTAYLADVRYLSPLWLLFLWPVLILAQHARSRYFSISLALAALGVITLDGLANSILTVIATDPDAATTLMLTTMVKVLWLSLLGFVHYVFVRYIMDQHRDLQLIHKVSREVMKVQDETRVLNRVVDLIANNLHYPRVHIFQVEHDGFLRCVAGAGAAGRERVERGFRIAQGEGIVGYVARTGKVYAANDVSKTDDADHPKGVYLPDDDLETETPMPRAEVAVPIKGWDQTTTAVLDIQVYDKGYFVPFDIDVLTMLADYIGWILSSRKDNLYRQKVAHNLLSPESWNLVLRSMLDGALKEFGAHSIVLFENDPTTKLKRGVAYAGQLAQEDMRRIDWSVVNPQGLVSKLLDRSGVFFQDDVATASPEPLFNPSPDHKRLKLPTFVERYGIRSRAVFVLRSNNGTIGVLFINYATRHEFGGEEKLRLELLADSIAAALHRDQIQRAQRSSDMASFERERLALHEELVNDVYGTLIGTTGSLNDLLRHVIGRATIQDGQRVPELESDVIEDLRKARMASDLLLADIVFLAHTNSAAVRGDFRDAIQEILTITRRSYSFEPKPVSIVDEWSGNPDQVPTGVTLAMKAVVSEILFHTIRRLNAQDLRLVFDISEAIVNVTINCDGLEASNYGGHARKFPSTSVRRRVERIGGEIEAVRTRQDETRIRIRIPLLPRYFWAEAAENEHHLLEEPARDSNG